MPAQTCPQCQMDVEVSNRFVKTVVCRYCGKRFTVSSDHLPRTPRAEDLVYLPTRMFALGKIGQIQTSRGKLLFIIAGRVRFADADGNWNEWFLELPDGTLGRLDEEEGVYSLFRAQHLDAEPPCFEDVSVGSTLRMAGQSFFVNERTSARVTGTEGKLSFPATVGETVYFVVGIVNGEPAALKYSMAGVEYSLGEELATAAIKLDDDLFADG